MFFYFFLDNNKKTLYLCNVFFIVLDLRLTKVRVAAATHFFALTSTHVFCMKKWNHFSCSSTIRISKDT